MSIGKSYCENEPCKNLSPVQEKLNLLLDTINILDSRVDNLKSKLGESGMMISSPKCDSACKEEKYPNMSDFEYKLLDLVNRVSRIESTITDLTEDYRG
jgi:hypothetical protein